MKMTLRNQSFEVKAESDMDYRVLDSFKKPLVQLQRTRSHGKTIWVEKDKFFLHNKVNNTFIFANGELESFILKLHNQGYSHHKPTIVTDKTDIKDTHDIEFISTHGVRDGQELFINALLSEEHNNYLVEARTGFGKTFITTYVMGKNKKRTMFYIRPTYIDKVEQDLKEYFSVNDDDIFIVTGSKKLSELMVLEKKPAFVIASNVTMMLYINKSYDAVEHEFTISPDKLLEHLGISLMVSDESHQFFNNLYKAVIALNPELLIGLSATLITKDKTLERMHYSLFPEDVRLGLKFYKKYTHFTFHEYRVNGMSENVGGGLYGYNHHKFEQYIISRKIVLHNYTTMIINLIKKYYQATYKPNDKLLVFAKSIDMINILRNAIQEEFKTLDVNIYVGGSDYKNIIESDISVSHPAKSGAAIDIPQLIYVINTINIDSPSQLMQMAGRLREIKGRKVRFIQIYSSNIKKHKIYILGNMRFINMISETVEWVTNEQVL